MQWKEKFDVVVVGSGAGGLLAAAFCARAGLEVAVLEKSSLLGGGSALSTGILFLPNVADVFGMSGLDSRGDSLTYLRRLNRGVADDALLEVYVDTTAELVSWIMGNTPLELRIIRNLPDFHCELDGGKTGGRHVTVVPFAAAQLGVWAEYVRKSQSLPISYYEIDEMGGPGNVKNWDFGRLAERITSDVRAQGAGLVAGLVKACLDFGVSLRRQVSVVGLHFDGERVRGVRVEVDGVVADISARRGVILATGGFEWNFVMNRRFICHPLDGPLTPPTNDGGGHCLAGALGAAFALMNLSTWCPVFHVPGEEYEGRPLWRNLASEKGRPHSILVNARGERFVNEGLPYADMASAFQIFDPRRQVYANLPMYFVFDSAYKEKFPVGPAMPGDPAPRWLVMADTLRQLAEEIGVNPDALERTIRRFNSFCKTGRDEDFSRGGTPFERYYGDPEQRPNPSLGPLENPPFYALEVRVGTFGNRGGVVCDTEGRVVDVFGKPIRGLYACGNVAAQQVLGLGYEGGGTLGQALIFGFRSARSICTGLR